MLGDEDLEPANPLHGEGKESYGDQHVRHHDPDVERLHGFVDGDSTQGEVDENEEVGWEPDEDGDTGAEDKYFHVALVNLGIRI